MAEFTSNANKGSVWNLLYQEGVFNSLGPNLVPQVKAKFDQIFTQIDLQPGDTFNKNKLVMSCGHWICEFCVYPIIFYLVLKYLCIFLLLSLYFFQLYQL